MNLTISQTPEEIVDLVRQLESEENKCLYYVVKDSVNCVNPTKTDTAWVGLRKWMNSSSRELKELYYIGAHRRFSDKLSEYLEPLVDLFSIRTPIRHLHP